MMSLALEWRSNLLKNFFLEDGQVLRRRSSPAPKSWGGLMEVLEFLSLWLL